MTANTYTIYPLYHWPKTPKKGSKSDSRHRALFLRWRNPNQTLAKIGRNDGLTTAKKGDCQNASFLNKEIMAVAAEYRVRTRVGSTIAAPPQP